MAGILPHALMSRGLTPEEELRGGIDPALAMQALDSNPIVDLLVRYLMQTEEPRRPKRESAPEPTPRFENRMKQTRGPIQANKPRQIANQRDRVMREIDRY